jgi:hypothetical protein
MFGVYIARLKRYALTGFGWEYAHHCSFHMLRQCFFWKACVPGCKKQHSKEYDFLDDLLIATAAIAATHTVV